ncbi:MAG: RNA polymerase factor sigma-54 [Nitrospirae bacterium]|nr:RNA polymerase factor sigma-54 [Nitrospirota bacterium]
MKARLELKLSQKLIMTPQLQQAIKLLQLSRLELSQTLSQEILENPLLEDAIEEEPLQQEENVKEDTVREERAKTEEDARQSDEPSDFDLKWEDYFDEYDDSREMYGSLSTEENASFEQVLGRSTTLVDHLMWQLGLTSLPAEEKKTGETIIGNIDENGYLCATLEEIAAGAKAPAVRVEKILKVIQGFDPPGVGARDLKECLLIQIAQLELKNSVVEGIIQHHLENLEKKRYSVIAKSLGISMEEVVQSAKIIEHLEPKPGRPYYGSENQHAVPDVLIVKNNKDYIVLLNDDGFPKLKISSYYKKLIRGKGKDHEATKSYLDDKLRSALWLIRSIEQRNRTILRVAESIVKFQKDFFDKGIAFLKPLVLRQVAEDIEMHESTVSRVTTNKYMYSPQGLFEFKYFFNSSIQRTNGEGEDLSSITVKDMIKKLIQEEHPGKPLKDQDIVNLLKKNQIEVARRTVAKYRTVLNIPPATRRKRAFL